MARKKPTRRRRGFRAVRVDVALDIGALAAAAITSGILVTNGTETIYLISADLTWSYAEHAAGQGTMECGLAHGDYSNTEITEWYNEGSVLIHDDKIVIEKSRRQCREAVTLQGSLAQEVANDGKAIRTPLRFTLESGQTLSMWVRNNDPNAFSGNTLVRCSGTLFYRVTG